jgi:hypothetical protein
MTEDAPTTTPTTDPPTGADAEGSSASPKSPVKVVEAELAPIIKDLPQPKQQQIRHVVEQKFEALIATAIGGGPKLDAETVKILAVAVEKENDNKFKFLTQKQANEAIREQREHEFIRLCHRDNVRLFAPVLVSAVVVFLVCVGTGIYFLAVGREAVGSAVLTGVFSAAFGYLGGLGTANFFKSSRPEQP